MIKTMALAAVAIAAALATPGAPARASDCPEVFVPGGYESSCSAGGAGEPWVLSVRPEGSDLDPLSSLTIRPVDEPVDEPSLWLREQLTLDTSGMTQALRDQMMADEVREWVPPALFDAFDQLSTYARVLDQIAVRDCSHADWVEQHDAWEMQCAWEAGPFRQTALLRLIERGDERIAVTAWASNERRLRHLTAIANGL